MKILAIENRVLQRDRVLERVTQRHWDKILATKRYLMALGTELSNYSAFEQFKLDFNQLI